LNFWSGAPPAATRTADRDHQRHVPGRYLHSALLRSPQNTPPPPAFHMLLSTPKDADSNGGTFTLSVAEGGLSPAPTLLRDEHSTAQHTTTQHSTTQHSTAQHSTTQHSTAHHTTPHHNTTQHSTAQHNAADQNTAQHCAGAPSPRESASQRPSCRILHGSLAFHCCVSKKAWRRCHAEGSLRRALRIGLGCSNAYSYRGARDSSLLTTHWSESTLSS